MGLEQYKMMLFQTGDDAWNAQEVETFANRHTDDVVVYLPAAPTQHSLDAHREFAANSFKAFPDQRVQNRPYKAFFAGGDWVCSIARYTGTMTGPIPVPHLSREKPGNDGNCRELSGSRSRCSEALSGPFPQVAGSRANGLENRWP